MRASLNSRGAVSAQFVDGYIYRFLQELLGEGDPAETGLGAYYAARVAKHTGALADYEAALAEWLRASFPKARCFLHVGIGLGTTTALLAAQGHRVVGVELDRKRVALAERLRAELDIIWPGLEERYGLYRGLWPDLIGEPPAADVVLFCTKLGGSPKPGVPERMIAAMPRYGHVVVDLRTFAEVLETEAERMALRDRFLAAGLRDGGPVTTAPGSYFHHFLGAGS